MLRLLPLALLLLPSLAAAQERAAVVSMGGGDVDAAVLTRTIELFEQRLHDDGFAVDTDGTPRLADGCHADCRADERRARELDVLVVLTLDGDTTAVTHALVSVIDALAEYTERETVEGRDAPLVAELAMVQALATRERGRRPWVSVSGRPEAAFVSIDGRDVGLVPWEGEVEAGEREVSVHLPGYLPFTQSIVAAPGAPVELEVELTPERHTTSDDVRRYAGLGTGIPILAAGLVMTVLGSVYAARAGECIDADTRGCRSGYVFGDTEGVLLGAGITSSVLGGILVFIGAY